MPIEHDTKRRNLPSASSERANAEEPDDAGGDGLRKVAEGIVRLELELGNDLADLQDKITSSDSIRKK